MESQKAIRELIDQYASEAITLPEMQRGYVWRKKQARDLLDSIYKGYPSGSILLWEIDDIYETRDSSIKIEETSKQNVRYLLLDGQQRLTSLVSMLKGIPTKVKVGNKIRDEPIDVFFNMNHPEEHSNFEDYDDDDDDDLVDYEQRDATDPDKLVFHLRSKRIENDPNWVSVTKLFTSDLADVVPDPNNENYKKFLQRVSDLQKVIDSYYYHVQTIPKSKNYIEVTDIFKRVNSSGVRLKASDLALAQITSRWPGSLNNEFLPFSKKCGNFNFSIDEGDIIKFLIAITTGKNKFEVINRVRISKLKKTYFLKFAC